jgi:hypothetical protein
LHLLSFSNPLEARPTTDEREGWDSKFHRTNNDGITKRLALLKELVPTATVLGALINPASRRRRHSRLFVALRSFTLGASPAVNATPARSSAI